MRVEYNYWWVDKDGTDIGGGGCCQSDDPLLVKLLKEFIDESKTSADEDKSYLTFTVCTIHNDEVITND